MCLVFLFFNRSTHHEVGTRLENSFALLLLFTVEGGDVGSHLEAQVVLQFGGIQAHTWLSHVRPAPLLAHAQTSRMALTNQDSVQASPPFKSSCLWALLALSKLSLVPALSSLPPIFLNQMLQIKT